MSYDSAEASVQDSEPIELIEIVRSDGVTHRHTSASHDVIHEGQRYTAITLDRTESKVLNMAEETHEVVLRLPIDHPLCRRWTQQATPPITVRVTFTRINGGEPRVIHVGELESFAAEDKIGRFNVPSRAGLWMLRAVPSLTVGRECPFMLYDEDCGVLEAGSHAGLSHKVTTTAIAVSGRNVTVDLGSTSRNGTWARDGMLVHVATGERMTIADQTDANAGVSAVATLQLQGPIVGLKTGDAVEVLAGCDWTIATCHTRFGNKRNFGGFPQLPTENPFTPGSSGVRKV